MSEHSVTIFVSSPGDVARERRCIVEAIGRLRHEFSAHFELEAVLWEDRPLSAAGSFQAQIVEPAKTDIVVLVLWWRLGTPLQSRDGWDRDFTGPLSGAEVTGTEWEFENALRAAQATPGKPFIIVFQKEGVPSFASDEEAFAYEREKARVIGFFDRWFRDGTAYVRAFRTFKTEAEFAELVDQQLEAVLLERLAAADKRRRVSWSKSPYRGLEAFDLASAPIFFGRTRVRRRLLDFAEARARSGAPWVLVTGASGSGKSSLVMAGLLADARQPGLLDGIGECRYVIVRPSDPNGAGDPTSALAGGLLAEHALPELLRLRYDEARLERILASGREAISLAVEQGLHAARATMPEHLRPLLMIIVDQLEEVFRLPPDRQEAFVAALAAFGGALDVWIVATLRSDFLADLDAHHDLARGFDADGRFLLSAPTDAEYAQIIQRPARAAGCQFEVDPDDGRTVDELLLEELRSERSSLPLLEHLLEQMWQRRTDDGLLTFAAHRELGGLTGAIARSADEVVGDDDVTADLRRTLVSMARLDDDGKWAKEKLRRADVPPAIHEVLERLVARRLLVAGEDGAERTLEVAHEQLFESWGRLAGWLRQSADEHRLHRELRLVARSWVESDRDAEPLLGGARLARALELRDDGQLRVDTEVREFIDASEAQATREERAAERARRQRLRRYAVTAGALGVLAAAMTAAAVIAVVQWRTAQRNADETKAVELASVSSQLADQSLDRALLLAVESYRRRPVPEAEASLASALARLPQLQRVLRGHADEVRAVAVSPNGELVASAARDYTIILWRPDGSQVRVIDEHSGEVHGLAFDSTGAVLVSSSDDGTIRRWNPSTGEQIGASLTGHVGGIRGVAVDPGDRWIASAGHDSTVRVWDLATGEETARLDDHDGFVLDVAFSADGGLLASSGMDGMVIIYRTSDFGEHDRVATGGGPARAVAFRPASAAEFAVAGEDGRVTVWEVGAVRPTSQFSHDGRVFDVAYSTDGTLLASGGRDQRVVVHDGTTAEVVEELDGHAGDVRALVFLPDGRLASGGRDRAVLLWDLAQRQRLAQRGVDGTSTWAVAYRDDDTRVVAVGDRAGQAVLVETSPAGQRQTELSADPAQVGYIAGGSEIVIGNRDGTVSFLDSESLQALEATTPAHASEVRALAVAPGGERVATGDAQGEVVLWDVNAHAVEARTSLPEFLVSDVAFLPDGRHLFVVDSNGSLWSWSLAPLSETLTEIADNRVRARSVTVSPDGRYLIVGTAQDQLQLYELDQSRPSLVSAVDHDGEIDDVAVNDLGRVAAASAESGTVSMWDVESGRSLGSFSVVAPRAVAVRDGSATVAVARPAGVEVWNFDIARMVQMACDVANRSLTQAEWKFYVGGQYRSTCPDELTPTPGS